MTTRPPGLPPFPPGHVWLCGAGPGDPGLLTLHAAHALREADIVVYDALVSDGVVAMARPGAERLYAGKRGGKASPKQRDISLQLVALARSGRRVLRLKGGDPFVFGRGGEEALALVRHGIPFRVIPGVTAGTGGLAYAGIPVTHREVNQAVTFVTGHDQTGAAPETLDWGAIARGAGVIVIYMGLKHIGRIAAALVTGGRDPDEPAAIVTEATLPGQRVLVTTLGAMAAEAADTGIEAPAIICVGEAVRLRGALDWLGQAAGVPPHDLDPFGTGDAAIA